MIDTALDLVERRVRRMKRVLMKGAVLSVALLGAIGMGCAALLGALAAVVLWLAESIGLPAALLCVSLLTLLAVLAVLWLALSRLRGDVGIAEGGLSSGGGDGAAEQRPGQTRAGESRSVGPSANLASSEPALLASAAFAAVSVLGVRRFVGVLRLAVAGVSAAAAIRHALDDRGAAKHVSPPLQQDRGSSNHAFAAPPKTVVTRNDHASAHSEVVGIGDAR